MSNIGTSTYICPEPQIEPTDKFILGYSGVSTPPTQSPIIPV